MTDSILYAYVLPCSSGGVTRTRTPSLAAFSLASSSFPSTLRVILFGFSGRRILMVAAFFSWPEAARPNASAATTATSRGRCRDMVCLRGGPCEWGHCYGRGRPVANQLAPREYTGGPRPRNGQRPFTRVQPKPPRAFTGG